MNETRKILDAPAPRVAPTTVRVPVFTSHSISVTAETEVKITAARARDLFELTPRSQALGRPGPAALPDADRGRGAGRLLRGPDPRGPSSPNGLSFWAVGDQLRKGAATNAVQIAELLVRSIGARPAPGRLPRGAGRP